MGERPEDDFEMPGKVGKVEETFLVPRLVEDAGDEEVAFIPEGAEAGEVIEGVSKEGEKDG